MPTRSAINVSAKQSTAEYDCGLQQQHKHVDSHIKITTVKCKQRIMPLVFVKG